MISSSFALLRSRRVWRASRKPPRRDRVQIWVKPRKSKVSGLPSPRAARAVAARLTKLDQPGLVRVQLQGEFRHPDAQLRQEPLGIGPVLKTNDRVVSVLAPRSWRRAPGVAAIARPIDRRRDGDRCSPE